MVSCHAAYNETSRPQDDEQGEDAEPDQEATQVDGGEDGSEAGEDEMAAHAQGLNFFQLN